MEGKIYKITSALTDKVYIGSTTMTLRERFQYHKDAEKSLNRQMSSAELIRYGDAKIELIHDFPCENRDELRIEEQQVMELFPTSINARRAFRTEEQKIEQMVLINQKCYERHKQINKPKIKQYQTENKEHIREVRLEREADGWFCEICEKVSSYANKGRHIKNNHT